MSNNILQEIADQKNHLIQNLLTDFLGHRPSADERSKFSIMNRLTESRIYFEGRLIGVVKNATYIDVEG
jgi:hypothetical protein